MGEKGGTPSRRAACLVPAAVSKSQHQCRDLKGHSGIGKGFNHWCCRLHSKKVTAGATEVNPGSHPAV